MQTTAIVTLELLYLLELWSMAYILLYFSILLTNTRHCAQQCPSIGTYTAFMEQMAEVANIKLFLLWLQLYNASLSKKLSAGAPRNFHLTAFVQKLWNDRYIDQVGSWIRTNVRILLPINERVPNFVICMCHSCYVLSNLTSYSVSR